MVTVINVPHKNFLIQKYLHSEFISTLSLVGTTVTDAGIYICRANIIGSNITLMR